MEKSEKDKSLPNHIVKTIVQQEQETRDHSAGTSTKTAAGKAKRMSSAVGGQQAKRAARARGGGVFVQ